MHRVYENLVGVGKTTISIDEKLVRVIHDFQDGGEFLDLLPDKPTAQDIAHHGSAPEPIDQKKTRTWPDTKNREHGSFRQRLHEALESGGDL